MAAHFSKRDPKICILPGSGNTVLRHSSKIGVWDLFFGAIHEPVVGRMNAEVRGHLPDRSTLEELVVDVASFDNGYVLAARFAQVAGEGVQQLWIGDHRGVPAVVPKHESGLDCD